jgi:diguanylate cyclase (GGDEF)-like protein
MKPWRAQLEQLLRERKSFSRNGMALLLLWPCISLVLGIVLWNKTLAGIEQDQQVLEQTALKNSGALARSYARYVARTIEQMDQITMHVKYDLESTGKPLQLEQMVQSGLFTAPQFSRVFIANRDGLVVSSSTPLNHPLSIAETSYFRFHKNNNSTALRMEQPSVSGGRGSKTMVEFSRRLETADESFDGVVVIAVDAVYLLSFYDHLTFGNAGLIALSGADGALRAARIGAAENDLTLVWTLPASDSGVVLEKGEAFADQTARYVGWQAVGSYPFVAMAGLSRQEVFAPYQETWNAYRRFAFVGSVFLFLFAVVAMLLSARLGWRKQQEAQIRASYRIATEGGNDGFYLLQPVHNARQVIIDFVIIDCNERAAIFFGIEKDRLLGARFSARYDPEYFVVVLQSLVMAMRTGFYEDQFDVPSESPLRMKSVRRRMVLTGTHLALTLQDTSYATLHKAELSRVAKQDELTGLSNRSGLMLALPPALALAVNGDHMVAVLVVGLDDFKNVNDAHGHSAGDELLRSAARRLQDLLGPGDLVARLGGDEFALILENLAHDQEANNFAERISQAFHQPFNLAAATVTLTASIGIGVAPRDGTDAESLLKNADIAMHSAKSGGKGRFRFFDPQLFEVLRIRLDTEQALMRAIDSDEIQLFYQPRVDTRSGEMRSMEALVRWMRPGRGMVSPLEFIPLAEETGLILRLGEVIIERAFEQLVQWKMQGLPLLPVSINVSARQFSEGNIDQFLAACLQRFGIDPSLIEIEITESATMGDNADTIAELIAIRALGIKLFIDDFGTGYSSLSQLQRLKMDSLKVDRNFTAELCRTTEGEVFFKAIVSMAHALGMTVVAEGVETAQELRVLQMLDCDEVQGYLISRPMPAAAIPALLRQRFLFAIGLESPVSV